MGNGTGVEKTNSLMTLSCHRMEKAPILNLASQIHVLLLTLFSKTLALLMPCPVHFPLRTRETIKKKAGLTLPLTGIGACQR